MRAGAALTSTRRTHADAYLAIAVLALIWGYSWPALKVSTLDASPMVVAWVRCAGGALSLLVALAVSGRSLRPPPFVPTLIYGVLQTTGFHLFQTMGVSMGGAGKSAVLSYTMPFWTTLLAWPFLGEPITRARWGVLALAGLGLALLVTPLRSANLLPNVLPVLAGLSWALSAVWVVRVRSTGDFDLLSLITWQMVWGTIALLPFTSLFEIRVHVTARLVLSMSFLVVFSTALGWGLWLFVLSRLPASVAAVGSLATPVVAVVAAAIQLHEIPTRQELVGIACLVVALVVNTRVPVARAPSRVSGAAPEPR